MKSKLRLFPIVVAAASVSTMASQAALVVAYESQAAAYTVSSSDLINGLTPALTVPGEYNTFTQEGCTVGSINNGALVPRGDGAENYAAVGSVNGGAGIVYDLAASSDVSSITLYFGWNDGGRDNAAPVSIFAKSSVYASDLGSYSFLAATVETEPSAGGYFSRVTISDDAGNLASSVRSLYFSFGNPENQWTGLGEIDVIAAAPPVTVITSGNTYSAGGVGDPGTQILAGGLQLDTGSIFQWDLDATSGADPGIVENSGTYDKVTGNGTGDGIFNLVLGTNLFTDPFWDTNKSWTDIFSGTDPVFTLFSGTDGVSSVSSSGFVTGEGQFSYTGGSLNWTAVPEPSGALVAILLGTGLLRRRRKA